MAQTHVYVPLVDTRTPTGTQNPNTHTHTHTHTHTRTDKDAATYRRGVSDSRGVQGYLSVQYSPVQYRGISQY